MTTTWPPELRHLTPGHHDRDWMAYAACRGSNPEMWFATHRRGDYSYPTRATRTLTRMAILVCKECPVRRECLQYALETDSRFGVFGGLTETDRAKLHWKKDRTMTCQCSYIETPHTFTHGPSGYSNHGCRCDICTTAHREYARQHRGYKPSRLADENERLTFELEALTSDYELLREHNMALQARIQELELGITV